VPPGCIYIPYGHQVMPQWKVVFDRTAQVPNMTGFELVSPILAGVDGHQKLVAMLEALNLLNPDVSKACGHHVHINAKDLAVDPPNWRPPERPPERPRLMGIPAPQQNPPPPPPPTAAQLTKIKKVCVAYIMYEKAFDLMTSKSRQAELNEFCQSNQAQMVRIHGSLQLAVEAIKGAGSLQALVDLVNPEVGRGPRYMKLNLTNLTQGRHRTAPSPSFTIEFRQHQAAHTPEKSDNWVELIQRFFHNAITREDYVNPPEVLQEQPTLLWLHMMFKMINRLQLTRYFWGRINELDDLRWRRPVRAPTEFRRNVAEHGLDWLKQQLYQLVPRENPQNAPGPA